MSEIGEIEFMRRDFMRRDKDMTIFIEHPDEDPIEKREGPLPSY